MVPPAARPQPGDQGPSHGSAGRQRVPWGTGRVDTAPRGTLRRPQASLWESRDMSSRDRAETPQLPARPAGSPGPRCSLVSVANAGITNPGETPPFPSLQTAAGPTLKPSAVLMATQRATGAQTPHIPKLALLEAGDFLTAPEATRGSGAWASRKAGSNPISVSSEPCLVRHMACPLCVPISLFIRGQQSRAKC